MTLLQLKVNEQKSFSTGHFRESCGGDYYRGFDVTPVKAKTFGATEPGARLGTLEASNNFFRKGFWRTSASIEDILRRYIRSMPIVKLAEDDAFNKHLLDLRKSSALGTTGLAAFSGSWYNHLPLRWRKETSSVEYRAYGPHNRTERYDRVGRSRLRKFLLENPIRHHLDSNEYDSDLLGRGKAGDRIAWRALKPLEVFRANRQI
jgi:hypothetical protein